MTNNIADDFYIRRQLRLTRIMYLAKILAWLINSRVLRNTIKTEIIQYVYIILFSKGFLP
jgi:hypothetical protein